MAALTKDAVGGSQNIIAGLDCIAYSELGPDILAGSDDGYNVVVGSTVAKLILFSDYSRHPNRLETLTIKHKDGSTSTVQSTAAGRYQILYRYAVVYMKQLSLHDFGKISQDRIGLQLFRETGALELFRAGKFYAAIHAARSRWASLPGAGYGQHENKVEPLVNAYLASGGVITDAAE